MTDIKVRPNFDFGLSSADRQHPAGPWVHSFLGTIIFSNESRCIQEDSVPVVFLLSSIIEASVLIINFDVKSRMIPVPSTDREIMILTQGDDLVVKLNTGLNDIEMALGSSGVVLPRIFDILVDLMKCWKPARLDDKHFVRSNWIIGAALDVANEKIA